MTRLSCSVARAFGAGALAVLLTGHVGSPDVFFAGRAGGYDLRVMIRPPQVVPGIAQVIVHAPRDAKRVWIRPVFWRAGSRGAPSPDETRALIGDSVTFEGSLWLMQRGAYSVDVIVDGRWGRAHVLVPVASVAIARLPLSPALGALLAVLAIVLVAGLINIVYKGAGESLVEPGAVMESSRRRRARRVAAIAVPILGLALLAGARWWDGVDRDYARTIYKPSALGVTLTGDMLRLRIPDTLWLPNRPAELVSDHGKLMHLFLIRADDARAFAHLHPQPTDTSALPEFETRIPPLPAGTYHMFADVVHETGFERTLVGTIALGNAVSVAAIAPLDPDDAWFVGEASRDNAVRRADGSTMRLDIAPPGSIQAARPVVLRVSVLEASGIPARLDPYLGMSAHAVVERVDGEVYVHMHPMGTVSSAARAAFAARDRGDTTADGRLRLAVASTSMQDALVEFPYAFPRAGSYRLFVQVKRNGRILTGAFALSVAEAALAP